MIVTSERLDPEKGTPEYDELDKWYRTGNKVYTVSQVMSQRMHYLQSDANDEKVVIDFNDYRDTFFDILQTFSNTFYAEYEANKKKFDEFLFFKLESFFLNTKDLLNKCFIDPKLKFDNKEIKSLIINIPFNAYITRLNSNIYGWNDDFDKIFIKLIEFICEHPLSECANAEYMQLDRRYDELLTEYNNFRQQISLSKQDTSRYNSSFTIFDTIKTVDSDLSKFLMWKGDFRESYLNAIAIYAELTRGVLFDTVYEISYKNSTYYLVEKKDGIEMPLFLYNDKDSIYDIVDKIKDILGDKTTIDFSRPEKDWKDKLFFNNEDIKLDINIIKKSDTLSISEKQNCLKKLIPLNITSEIVAIVDKDVTTMLNINDKSTYNIIHRNTNLDNVENSVFTSIYSSNYIYPMVETHPAHVAYLHEYSYIISGNYASSINDSFDRMVYDNYTTAIYFNSFDSYYWGNYLYSYSYAYSYTGSSLNSDLIDLSFGNPDGSFVKYLNVTTPNRMIDKCFVKGYFTNNGEISVKYIKIDHNTSQVRFIISLNNWNHIYGNSNITRPVFVHFTETNIAYRPSNIIDHNGDKFTNYDVSSVKSEYSLIKSWDYVDNRYSNKTTITFKINPDAIGKWSYKSRKYITEANGFIKVYSYVGHEALLKYWVPEYNQKIAYRYDNKFYDSDQLYKYFTDYQRKRVINDSEVYILTTLDMINICAQ